MTPIICARTGKPVDPVAPRRTVASWAGPDVAQTRFSVWPAADVRCAAGWETERLRGVDRPLTGFMGDDGEMVWFNWEDG